MPSTCSSTGARASSSGARRASEVPLNVLHARRHLRRDGAARGHDPRRDRAGERRVAGAAARPPVFAALTRSHPEVRDDVRGARERAGALELLPRPLQLREAAERGARAAHPRSSSASRSPAGDVVVREGDPPGPMYVIESGRARSSCATARGRPRLPPHRRLLRRALAASRRAARRERRGGHRTARCCASARTLFRGCSTSTPSSASGSSSASSSTTTTALARVPLDFAEEILPGRGLGLRDRRPGPAVGGRGPARRRGARRRGATAKPPDAASGASRTSTSSTRWTAAPRAWR